MGAFEIIAGICSIASLLVSLFIASKVVKISYSFNHNNEYDNSRTVNEVKGANIYGSYSGRNAYVVENHKQD